MRSKTFVVLCVLLCGAFCKRCAAQEFRVYTLVYDRSTESTEPVARTLTLFHAGRVYDFMNADGEVIIFEPMQDRFIVMNTRRRMMTTVHLDEIRQKMQAARKVTGDHEKKLRQKGDATSTATADMLAFQLKPEFREHFDRDKQELSLQSSHLRYDVRLSFVEQKSVAENYRQYADWISRLNFILHPRVLLPGPRLTLNQQLEEKQAIPLQVELTVNTRPRIQLRAEHRIAWSLDQKDRAFINDWNKRLSDPTMRKVTLRKYQQSLGIEPVSKR